MYEFLGCWSFGWSDLGWRIVVSEGYWVGGFGCINLVCEEEVDLALGTNPIG